MGRRVPAYEAIAGVLRRAIETGNLAEGTVLLEGPIATLFDSSRSPVKQALATLEADGLARRFDGRGLLAGASGGPVRDRITPAMLDLADVGSGARTFAWEAFYYDFERTVILRAVFGPARINELALARHYGVGRTVAGGILGQAVRNGIVLKDGKARWCINPLAEARFRHLYELRILLEPAALRTAVERVPADVVGRMRYRLGEAARNFPDVDAAQLDALEEDLHVDLLGFGTNAEIVEALKRTRCVLVAGKHIQRAVRGRVPVDAFMGEHAVILDAVAAGRGGAAERALVDHLERSGRKSIERLQAYRSAHTVSHVPYVLDLSAPHAARGLARPFPVSRASSGAGPKAERWRERRG